MKTIIFILFVSLAMVSCQQQDPQSNEALRKKTDSLASELAEVKSVLDFVINGAYDDAKKKMEKEKEVANKVWDLKIDESPSTGNPKAKLVIVEFTEFQCPYCARIAPMLDSVVRANPDKIRLVYKHFPLGFHKEAPAAGAAVIAAGEQGKFWEYRWALAPHFSNLNDSTFIAVAQQVGLNVERFKKDMVLDAAKQKIIDRDMQLGMEVGVQGTPNFYINGKRQNNISPDIIDRMLKDIYK